MNSLSYRLLFILCAAWRRRYMIILPIIIFPICGLLISFFSAKNYSSHTSMLIQETAKLNPFLEDLAVSAMLKERMSALKTLLHSRHILSAVAREMQWVNADTSAQQHDSIIAKISSALTVSMQGKDLIRIDYRANEPAGMKEMLGAISRQFVEQLLAPERSSMTDSSQFLSQHLKSRQIELNSAELALAEFKQRNANDLPELHLANVSRLSKLKQRLSEQEAKMAGASRSLGGLDQQLSKTNPVLGRIEQKIVQTRAELALLRVRYTDKHSAIMAALRQLQGLEQERQQLLAPGNKQLTMEQLWVIASSAQLNMQQNTQPLLISQLDNIQKTRSQVDSLSSEINSLKHIIAELESNMSGYGAKASVLSNLERELTIKRALYDDLLLRHEKVGITGSLGIFERDKRIKVIDRPFTPNSPSNLPVILFLLCGLIAGVVFGSSLALAFELSDNRIRRRDTLEALSQVPVLGRIPNINSPSKAN
jgi:polysaccharide chain length determinant protein (PEP-CTERM system associated)